MEERLTGKREQILEAAARVFSDKGFHSAKIKDIAQAAQIGKGTVYEYFASKEELFMEMLKDVSRTYHDKIFTRLQEGVTCSEKIRYLLFLHLLFIHEHEKLARMLMTEPVGLSDPVRTYSIKMRREILGLIVGLLKEGIENGEFRPMNVQVTAQVLLGAAASVGFSRVLDHEQFIPEEITEEILKTILYGIRREKGDTVRPCD